MIDAATASSPGGGGRASRVPIREALRPRAPRRAVVFIAPLIIAQCVSLGVTVSGCGRPADAPAAAEPAGSAAPPATTAASRAVAPRLLTGVVRRWPARTVATPLHGAAVAAPVAGIVREILVAPGDVVAAGAPLLRLASAERAALAATVRALHGQQQVLERRLGELRRLQQQGLIEGGARWELERELAALHAEIGKAQGTLAAAGDGGCAGARAATAPVLTLCAPLAGVVAAVGTQLGAAVGPEDGALVQLAAAGPARIEITRLEAVPAGATLQFRSEAMVLPLQPRPLAERIDATDGATVAVHLPQAATMILAGVRGEVEVRLARADVVAVPRTALAWRDGALRVFAVAAVVKGDAGREGGGGAAVATPGLAVELLGGDGAEAWIAIPSLAPDALRRLVVQAVAPALAGGEEE